MSNTNDNNTDFDIERLEELRVKAESGELTDEEMEEAEAMMTDFHEHMQPVAKSMTDMLESASISMAESLRPIIEATDTDSE